MKIAASMANENSVAKMKCGSTSHIGTERGIRGTSGSSTVNAGIVRIRFSVLGLKKIIQSLVFHITMMARMNIEDSMSEFSGPVISIVAP